MQPTPIQTKRSTAGFTLVEILVVAPIVILVIAGFVSLFMSMVGDTLISRDRNALNYNTQNALDTIEQDTRLSTQFLATSGTLPSPQGSNNGTSAFSSSNSLILGSLTTTQNPLDPNRKLIYYANQPNICGPKQTSNRLLIAKVIYFVNGGSLWRRTIVPPYNTISPPNDTTVCDEPWQRNSCAAGTPTGAVCKTDDVKLMEDITSFTVKYYSSPGSTTDLGTANALQASTIEATIQGSKTIAGRTVDTKRSIRATKLNSIDVDVPPPTTPTVNGSLETPNKVRFSWNPVPGATSYSISYNINGGAWVNVAGTTTDTNYTVNTTVYRKDTVSIRVTARNATGLSPYGSGAFTVPEWIPCDLQNGWGNVGSNSWGWAPAGEKYSSAAFTKTSANIVVLKGVVTGGNTAYGTTICVLPPEYRPTGMLTYQVDSNGTGRINIQPTGEVMYIRGTSSYTSLDNIAFIPSGAYSWSLLPRSNGWTNFGSGYEPIQATQDSMGRIFTEGLGAPGTNTAGTIIATVPVAYRPNAYYHFIAADETFSNFSLNTTGGMELKKPSSGYLSLQSVYYPASVTNSPQTVPTFSNGWKAFNTHYSTSGYSSPMIIKASDGMVTMQGLIAGGSTASGTVIATLPAGYRPRETMIVSVSSADAQARIHILSDGTIRAIGGVNTSWVSLDGITFMGDQ